ncbi:hypothetical protein JI739_17765 [Ramlibacter sp. AW1]|uniref:Uncharacterized protein n=1 Tax=Ramlibacter aurantiacus TaxID=2801330 RepID=A0A936ZRC2_9BURK|nr:hypothetical protein [Ramlibacter aurantiacus]MBL0422200.1 hypothetical protein [Ramlibacter aurantiacus]
MAFCGTTMGVAAPIIASVALHVGAHLAGQFLSARRRETPLVEHPSGRSGAEQLQDIAGPASRHSLSSTGLVDVFGRIHLLAQRQRDAGTPLAVPDLLASLSQVIGAQLRWSGCANERRELLVVALGHASLGLTGAQRLSVLTQALPHALPYLCADHVANLAGAMNLLTQSLHHEAGIRQALDAARLDLLAPRMAAAAPTLQRVFRLTRPVAADAAVGHLCACLKRLTVDARVARVAVEICRRLLDEAGQVAFAERARAMGRLLASAQHVGAGGRPVLLDALVAAHREGGALAPGWADVYVQQPMPLDSLLVLEPYLTRSVATEGAIRACLQAPGKLEHRHVDGLRRVLGAEPPVTRAQRYVELARGLSRHRETPAGVFTDGLAAPMETRLLIDAVAEHAGTSEAARQEAVGLIPRLLQLPQRQTTPELVKQAGRALIGLMGGGVGPIAGPDAIDTLAEVLTDALVSAMTWISRADKPAREKAPRILHPWMGREIGGLGTLLQDAGLTPEHLGESGVSSWPTLADLDQARRRTPAGGAPAAGRPARPGADWAPFAGDGKHALG